MNHLVSLRNNGGAVLSHTVKLLNVRLSVLLHLGHKLWHFPQDLHVCFFYHLGEKNDTDIQYDKQRLVFSSCASISHKNQKKT